MDDLKSQLQNQKKSTKTFQTPVSRVYFFKRKEDNHYFAIDNEKQASHMIRRKDFNSKFEFIGWGSGRHTLALSRLAHQKPEFDAEGGATEAMQDQHEKNLDNFYEAMEKDIQEAMENPDKTPPRDFRKLSLDGAPLNNSMSEWLNMFNR